MPCYVRCEMVNEMIDPEADPLWYDRVDSEEEPGPLIWLTALAFSWALALYRSPEFALQACQSKLARHWSL